MDQETKLNQYSLDGKALFGYSDGTDVFVTFSQFVKEFAQDVPTATLQRKKRAVIESPDQYCPTKYLKLFKSVNAIGESAKKISVITLTQAHSLIALLAGRRLKHAQSPAVVERVESTAMEAEGGRMYPEPKTKENPTQVPADESSPATIPSAPGSTRMQSDSVSTENPAQGPAEETSPATSKRAPASIVSELNSTQNPTAVLVPPVAETEVKLTGSDVNPANNSEGTPVSGKKKRSLKVNLELHRELAKNLADLRTFYTRECNYKREGMKLCDTTIEKSTERIQVFLGYSEDRGRTPVLTDLADLELLEQFFTHKQESGSKPGTIAAYGQGLLHGLKYIEAVKCINTEHAQAYVRKVIQQFQQKAENARPKTWQDLSASNKWLHWEEIIEVLKTQRDVYLSEIAPKARAQESQDYAQLLLYTAIPPARAQEYRTLQLRMLHTCDKPHSRSSTPVNILHISEDGSTGYLEIANYKNAAYSGRQIIDISNIDYLLSHLVDYVNKDRPLLLLGKKDHHFLFMDKVGDPFTASRWTLHIQHIFEKHSGNRIGPNLLRSAFVTYLLDGQVSVSDSLARDIASAMRHSVKYQQRVYDKRTSQDRTAQALNFCSKLAANALDRSTNSNASFSEGDEDAYEVGDIVALVDKTATPSEPKIYIGKVLRTYPQRREAFLAYLQPVPKTRSKYQLTVGKDGWMESYDALIYPVDIIFDEGSNVYTLRTKPEDIYKLWLKDQ